ncbi:TraR/DksA C4-type zinc finger protein [candidate division WOR-3 bacterium]|nr:TraR/DksA C4-type zinc finger protein [candidate division WOR-3 bacterium]
MTKREMQRYARRLLEEKLRLLREIGVEEEYLAKVAREASGDISSFSFHMADQSGETFRRELQASLTSEQIRTLRAIDEALKRIYEGTYGKCTKCGEKISKERLDYIPYARHCISCQRSFEGS